MPFSRKPQKFNAAIKNPLPIGSGDKAVTLGGENVLPFASLSTVKSKRTEVGVEITDLGMEGEPESVKAPVKCSYAGEIAKSGSCGRCRFPRFRLAGGGARTV